MVVAKSSCQVRAERLRIAKGMAGEIEVRKCCLAIGVKHRRRTERERMNTNLDLSFGNVERQVAENNLATSIGASTRDDDGRLVAVRSSNYGGVLSASTNSGGLGTRAAATTSTSTSLVVPAGSGLLGAIGNDLVEGCESKRMEQKYEASAMR